MRIVLDTNVLVSGLLQPRGPSGRIVRLVAAGELALAVDPRILAEYEDVLAREKFGFDPVRIGAFLEEIRSDALSMAARPLQARLPDPDDEPFLEVARAARVEALVTGNLRHYPEEGRAGVLVLSPRDLVELLRRSGSKLPQTD